MFKIPVPHFILLFIFVIFSLSGVILNPSCSGVIILEVSVVFLAVLVLVYRHRSLKIKYDIAASNIQERINNVKVELENKKKISSSLDSELKRLEMLEYMSNKLSQINEPLQVYELASDVLAKVFSELDLVMIYLANPKDTSLELVHSVSRILFIKLKEKKGDLLDKSALRLGRGIVIENVDNPPAIYAKYLDLPKARGIKSLVVSPLVLEDKDVGLLRLEARKSGYFNIEDLRFLAVTSDLLAVAIDKAFLYRRVEELAIKDSLTGLYLRTYFFARLKEEMKKAFVAQKSVGILMLDIDFFKKINDQYGHLVGDLVLKRLAKIIEKFLGPSGNIACRFGGEEFLVMLSFSSPQESLAAAEALRRKVEENSITFRRNKVKFTVSIGVASFPQDAKMIDDLIMEADSALYEAKKKGRNRVCSSAA